MEVIMSEKTVLVDGRRMPLSAINTVGASSTINIVELTPEQLVEAKKRKWNELNAKISLLKGEMELLDKQILELLPGDQSKVKPNKKTK